MSGLTTDKRSFSFEVVRTAKKTRRSEKVRSAACLRSCISSEANSLSCNNKNVSFNSVHIRSYKRVLDNNPSVSSGVALALGWDYEPEINCDLEEFETLRPPRRTKLEFQLPPTTREKILKEEVGCTKADIAKARKQINISKAKRMSSLAAQEVELAHILFESAVRKFKRFVRRTNKHKEEEKLWINAHKRAMQEETAKNVDKKEKEKEETESITLSDLSDMSESETNEADMALLQDM